MNGTIKSLIVDKNFGFITPEEGGKDVFFHASGLSDGLTFSQLHIGDKTSFDVEQSDKGPRAINVVLA